MGVRVREEKKTGRWSRRRRRDRLPGRPKCEQQPNAGPDLVRTPKFYTRSSFASGRCCRVALFSALARRLRGPFAAVRLAVVVANCGALLLAKILVAGAHGFFVLV